ncbi:TrmB family transcriptional regulator [Virgibacillus ndiopensis]|uniref:TrmB family transcriptional regulator n=1 Tax=Virgibacillus ndiopensis TaxID=2004408 RepID=UPI000C0761B6|nr:helix-turn-helix domain-containing protein [Virgibacillus ndiopensis]
MGDIVNTLKKIGMTEYEAKIYVSLLSNQPSNGNNIAKSSGVPAPKVYEALKKMNDQGLVFTVSGGNNGKQVRYSALPYKELLKSKKDTFMNHYEFLSHSLADVSSRSDVDWSELFVIKGYLSSIEVVQTAVIECNSQIILSCWKREFDLLRDLLQKAYERGVKIVTIIFDKEDIDVPWDCFNHYNEGLSRHNGELSVVIDNKKAILLHSLEDSPHSVVSSHPVMVSITRNYIRHDIYINRVIHDFEKMITDYYGQNLENLIDDF